MKYKFIAEGTYGTKVEQERVSDNLSEFVKVAEEHLLDGEKIVRVGRV